MPSRRLKEAFKTKPSAWSDWDDPALKLSPRRTAFHEAGHAVVNVLLGIHFSWVVAVEPFGWVDSANPCIAWQRGDGPKRDLARTWAISSYAGAAAEEWLGEGVATSYVEFDEASSWLKQFATPRSARFVGDETHDRQEERLKRRAFDLVGAHFASVKRVAEALLKIHALTRDEVESIMEGQPAPRR